MSQVLNCSPVGLKELNRKFDKLKIAAGLKCKVCDDLVMLYLNTIYLDTIGLLSPDVQFLNALIEDLDTHIREDHPDRYKYFIG